MGKAITVFHNVYNRVGEGSCLPLRGLLFIRKFIPNTIHCQNVLRFTGFDFDLAPNILDVRIDGAFIRFKSHAVNGIQ